MERMSKLAKEIERKFLVAASWQPGNRGDRIAQGYLCREPDRTVRVRLRGEKGYLTIKGRNSGITRLEYEYEIPYGDAEALLRLCEPPLVEKTRYVEYWNGFKWEIDVFTGANAGLVVAEIELPATDTVFQRPSWLLAEVSNDPRYYNSNLIKNPYSVWEK